MNGGCGLKLIAVGIELVNVVVGMFCVCIICGVNVAIEL